MSRLDEKRFTALGVEWIARFDFNSTCAIEEETGDSFYSIAAPFLGQMDEANASDPEKVLAALGGRYNSRIRLLLFHALSGQHELTIEEVGDIIGDIGLQSALVVVLWAIARGLGADDEDAEGNGKTTPVGNRRQRKAAAKAG
jgi:hypothetical protein